MRIALITTGKTELLGLPVALSRLFPNHIFVGIEDIPGRDGLPGRPFRSFTSYKLPPPPMTVPPAVNRLVAKATGLVDPAVATGYDLVMMIDDLELANRDQAGVVVDVVRHAAISHLGLYTNDPTRRAALCNALRAKVSFHIIRPMIESWFFGAPSALSTAGVPATIAYHIRPGDHEYFESTDRLYIAERDVACPQWLRRGRERGDRPKWIGAGPDRVFHPKGYLQWLMLDGSHPCCTTYGEAIAGVTALTNIDWGRLLGNPNRATFARAMVADLADGLNQQPIVQWQGIEAPETSIAVARPTPILRNI